MQMGAFIELITPNSKKLSSPVVALFGNSLIVRFWPFADVNPIKVTLQSIQLVAMINVLELKGVLTGKEVLDEMEVIVAANGKKEVN